MNAEFLRLLRHRDTFSFRRSVGAQRESRVRSVTPSGSSRWVHSEGIQEGSRGSRSAPPDNGHPRECDPGGVEEKRAGAVLVLVVMLLFALIAIAGLLIDIGMARLTQGHMQSVSDAAAIEGGWHLVIGADESATRDAVVARAAEMSDSWGPRRIELEDGYDLDGDGKLESAQTINRDTLGDPVRPALNPNIDNDIAGDIVLGEYVDSEVPDELPGQPFGYDRSSAFSPNIDEANSILVRLRRTGEDDIAGGTSAERLTYLWSRGSLLNFRLKGCDIAVRGETIAKITPALAVGILPETETQMSAIPARISIGDWNSLEADLLSSPTTLARFGDSTTVDASKMLVVGTSTVNLRIDRSSLGIGYVSIVNDSQVIVGFGLSEVSVIDGDLQITKLASATSSNASANLALIDTMSFSIVAEQENVRDLVMAPVLVRSRQIQGGTP